MDIFFDTSGLPRKLASPGQAFYALRELADAGLVSVLIPEIVARERESQVAKGLKALEEHVSDVIVETVFHDEELCSGLHAAWKVLREDGGVSPKAERILQGFMNGLKAKVVKSDESDLASMWELYFSGSGPFSSMKNRKDIPDAFVYLCAKSMSLDETREMLHCVIHDGNLAKAVKAIPGCRVYSTLLDLMESKAGKKVLGKLPWEQAWALKVNEAIESAEKSAKGYTAKLSELVEEELPAWSLEDGLPGSGGTVMGGHAVEAGKYTIDWSAAESIGPGWVEIPFAGKVSAEYEYGIYPPDTFRLPSRVHIQQGDFEHDSVFDASCVVELSVNGRALLKFTEENIRDSKWDEASVEVEIDELEVSDAEDFDEEEEDYDWEPPESELFE